MADRFHDDEIIDVAYQTATEEDILAAQQRTAQNVSLKKQSEDALYDLAKDVMLDPERCFCRNCGQPVYKNASVCVNCHYVINPAALRQGQRLVRARRESYEKGHRIRHFITNLTGIEFETPEQKARWAVRKTDYHFTATSGKTYCVNCGCNVDPGASVCVNCNYVLNPAAVRRAQMAISDKTAKFTRKDLIRCLLIPLHGVRQYHALKERRPQVALPSLYAGIGHISAVLLAIAVIIAAFFS